MLMQRMTPRFDAMRPTLYPPYRDRAAWQALPGAARRQAAGQAALRDAAAVPQLPLSLWPILPAAAPSVRWQWPRP